MNTTVRSRCPQTASPEMLPFRPVVSVRVIHCYKNKWPMQWNCTT